MVIDDEEVVRNSVSFLLRDAGYETETAADGHEGLEIARLRPVDLVITDMVMPEREGVITILDLRRDLPVVKIIAMSGYGEQPENGLKMAARFGAHRTLTKPFQREELLSLVAELTEAPGEKAAGLPGLAPARKPHPTGV